MKYLFITFEGLSLPIAYALQREGQDVTVAQIQDIKELGIEGDKEEPEMKERRLSLYEGMLTKTPADKVMKVLPDIQNKDEYFVFCDFNNLYKFAEQLLAMGFKNGLFPTEEQFQFERDRDKAKKFVQENYKDLKVAEKKEFKTIEDGKKFIEESEKIWVLKGNSDNAKTVVPNMEDPEQAKVLISSALDSGQKDYEDEGFILEEKILNPIEITPEMVFWNGVPLFSDIDIETKYREAGDKGIQVGCGTSVIFRTEIDNPINQIAFPPAIHEMAAKQTGLFIWDSSILIDPKTGDKFFGEYCPNRFGWDAIFGEIAMSGPESGEKMCTTFFEAIVAGKNPLVHKFGTTVRLFNEHHDSFGKLKGGDIIEVDKKAEPDVYLYEAKKEEDKIISAEYYTDLAVVTGYSDTSVQESCDRMYQYVDMVAFNGPGYRYKGDFLATDYPTALMNRNKYLTDNKII